MAVHDLAERRLRHAKLLRGRELIEAATAQETRDLECDVAPQCLNRCYIRGRQWIVGYRIVIQLLV